MKKNLLHIALASTLGLSALPAFSANPGSLGSSSQGDVNLNLTIADEIQITGLTDITISRAVVGTTQTATGNSDFCVYSNAGDFTVTPSNASGSYNLTGDNLNGTIAYTVNFGGADVDINTASAALTPSTSLTCADSITQNVEINISDAALQNQAADTYRDTLVLTVAPL